MAISISLIYVSSTFFILGLLFERFTVHGFNLMKDILYCHMYRPAKAIEGIHEMLTLCLTKHFFVLYFDIDSMSLKGYILKKVIYGLPQSKKQMVRMTNSL